MSSPKPHEDYSNDPKWPPHFMVNKKQPFNAEPPPADLIKSFITPNHNFFKRNHGPIPDLDPHSFRLDVVGMVETPLSLSLEQIKKMTKVTITATVQCAGNRRTEMHKLKTVKGVGWAQCTLGTAVWGGVRLCDVLKLAGAKSYEQGAKHVEFVSVDPCSEDDFRPYTVSIPMTKASRVHEDTLIAYEMNGEPLPREHGFPFRIVVPGYVGARSCKWVKIIRVQAKESDSFFQARDYKSFNPMVDWNNVDFSKATSITDLPVTAGILTPVEGQRLPEEHKTVTVKGYAYSGGGRFIERVDVSTDDGKTWHTAELFRDEGEPNRVWTWALWRISLPKPAGAFQIICKATDSSYNTMPENIAPVWNLRGVVNNAWFRVNIPGASPKL